MGGNYIRRVVEISTQLNTSLASINRLRSRIHDTLFDINKISQYIDMRKEQSNREYRKLITKHLNDCTKLTMELEELEVDIKNNINKLANLETNSCELESIVIESYELSARFVKISNEYMQIFCFILGAAQGMIYMEDTSN